MSFYNWPAKSVSILADENQFFFPSVYLYVCVCLYCKPYSFDLIWEKKQYYFLLGTIITSSNYFILLVHDCSVVCMVFAGFLYIHSSKPKNKLKPDAQRSLPKTVPHYCNKRFTSGINPVYDKY